MSISLRSLRVDSIARRLALTIALAVLSTLALDYLFSTISGFWARPSFKELGLPNRAAFIIQLMEAAPPSIRHSVATAASAPDLRVDWYPGTVPANPTPDNLSFAAEGRRWVRNVLQDPGRELLLFDSDSESARSPHLIYDRLHFPEAKFLATPLADGSWLVITATRRTWGPSDATRKALNMVFLVLSVVVVSTIANRQLGHPFQQFAAAASRFDGSRAVKPIAEKGPVELRTAIQAFNAMWARIQRYVADETNMLAAISHDLRVPLTRIRLRAEFVDDPEQQSKLFRDVDAMEAMLASALTFLKDNSGQEDVTTVDLSELLLTIVEDFSDQGFAASFSGPDRVALRGRPVALTRGFTNLVDNALKYGASAEIVLGISGRIASIRIEDRGPGIADAKLQAAFDPFVRLDTSRSPATGGVGLGLTSARAIFRMHGGDIVLKNAPGGGLHALVTLPLGDLISNRPHGG
jgi:signal transduction histidine kinase